MSRFTFMLVTALLAAGLPGAAAAPWGEPVPDRQAIGRLIDALDSDEYETRREAAARLEQWVGQDEWGPLLAEEFQRAAVRSDLSFEVRWHLERWLPRLPKLDAAPVGEVSADELDRLVEQLDSDSFAVRLGADRRLDWLLTNPDLITALLTRLKARLAATGPSSDSAGRLEACWERARGAWLLAGAPTEGLPPVTDAHLAQWVGEIARPVGDGSPSTARAARRRAQRELRDAMAQDALVGRIAERLEAARARAADPLSRAALGELLELTRPAMVAEYWQDGRHLGEQHLLVGVPSQADGALRPSHFDAIDDRVARCVSGNTLMPGEYPAGVAFPHPHTESAFFHLVNLPTPRRRMAYAYEVKGDEQDRLLELSRRTLQRFLAERRGLTEPELVMLAQLDPVEVSRFAGTYLDRVADAPLPLTGPERFGGRPSRHGLLAVLLAWEGTKEAGPGLAAAIRKGAFLPPTSVAPYRLEFMAALAIAQRDPWPEADAWLASQADRNEPVADGLPEGPDLGATAAAILLRRHRQTLSQFGLRPVAEPLLLELGLEGFRFVREADRAKVHAWWTDERTKRPPDDI